MAYQEPTKFTIEHRNKAGSLIQYLHPWARGTSWEWNRKGGCGRCKIQLFKGYRSTEFNAMDDIQIKMFTGTGTAAQLVYRGWVASASPKLSKSPDVIILDVRGYFDLLKFMIIHDSGAEKVYTSQLVSLTVTDIIDNFVVANSDITKGTIDASSFSADSLKFKESASSALETCDELLGNIEYGVGPDLVFHWRTQSTTVNNKFIIGNNVSQFQRKKHYNKLINKIYFEGGETGSGLYTVIATASDSITNYFLSEDVVVNTSITTSSTANQYLTILLNRDSEPKTQYKITIPNTDIRLEDNIPLGKIAVYDADYDLGSASSGIWGVVSPAGGSGWVWGRTPSGGSEKIWGGGSGSFQDQIDKVNYTLSETDGRVQMVISTGDSGDVIAARLKRLENKIDNIRQRG